MTGPDSTEDEVAAALDRVLADRAPGPVIAGEPLTHPAAELRMMPPEAASRAKELRAQLGI